MRNLVQKQLFLLGVVLVFCADLQAKTPSNGENKLENTFLAALHEIKTIMLQACKKLEQNLQQDNLDTSFNFQNLGIKSKLIAQFVENNFVFPPVFHILIFNL